LHARLRHHGIEDRVTIEDRFVADDEIAGVFGPGTVAAFPYREIEASGVLGLATIYGRPIIASRIGLFAEGLTDGVHGHVVPCEDVPALADAMAHMITDPAFTRSCAGAVAALAQASPGWTEVGRLTACVYADVLRHGAAQAPAQTRQWAEGLAS
jgi:glycosyltransferase involved in cell wall biosynthesis